MELLPQRPHLQLLHYHHQSHLRRHWMKMMSLSMMGLKVMDRPTQIGCPGRTLKLWIKIDKLRVHLHQHQRPRRWLVLGGSWIPATIWNFFKPLGNKMRESQGKTCNILFNYSFPILHYTISLNKPNVSFG